jgi:spore coat polysaccharide biosynthesis predicted glycosyltransferase SpsG
MTAGQEPALDGRTLVIRTDASPASGTGHLMRMLALGQAWMDMAGSGTAVIDHAPAALLDRLEHEGFTVESGSVGAGPEAAMEAVATRLRADPSAVAAIDLVGLSAVELQVLERAVPGRTLLVDDRAQLPAYPAALVLNQNAHADRAAYPAARPPDYLIGLRYVLLRREFRARSWADRRVPAQARHVLITFGGSDPARMTLRSIRALAHLPGALLRSLDVRVIVGAANPDWPAVEAAAARSPATITLERSVSNMPERIAWADLVLVSGGTTVWELAAMGCPALVVETAPSEPDLTRGLRRIGLFDVLGPAEALDDAAIAEAVATRIPHEPWRRAMAELGPTHVDGQGAVRVASALASLVDVDAGRSLPGTWP